MVRITKTWYKDTERANAVGKLVATGLLDTGLPQNFNLEKKSNIRKVQ